VANNPSLPESIVADQTIRRTGAVCVFGLGLFLLWSLLAPLAEGVVAIGTLIVEDERKIVQHLEGGIIKTIHVREGAMVEAGEPIIELDQLPVMAQRDEIAQELAAELAAIARLTALSDEASEPDFLLLQEIPLGDDIRADIMARQISLFEQQQTTHQANLLVLEARRAKALAGSQERKQERNAVARAIDAARTDYERKRTLLARQLETGPNVERAARELAELQGRLARLTAESFEAEALSAELAGERAKAVAEFRSWVRDELAEGRRRALSAQERLARAEDVVRRSIIYAPQSGVVLNLAFVTVGGVISPGEPILELVPSDQALIAEVKLAPTDREAVFEGSKVRVRLAAYKSWLAPPIEGQVLSVSADLKYSPDGKSSYYETLVKFDRVPDGIPEDRLTPGMPVEAFISAGRYRTFASYVVEPIVGVATRGTQN